MRRLPDRAGLPPRITAAPVACKSAITAPAICRAVLVSSRLALSSSDGVLRAAGVRRTRLAGASAARRARARLVRPFVRADARRCEVARVVALRAGDLVAGDLRPDDFLVGDLRAAPFLRLLLAPAFARRAADFAADFALDCARFALREALFFVWAMVERDFRPAVFFLRAPALAFDRLAGAAGLPAAPFAFLEPLFELVLVELALVAFFRAVAIVASFAL